MSGHFYEMYEAEDNWVGSCNNQASLQPSITFSNKSISLVQCDLAQSELQEVTEGQGESLAAQLQTLFIRTSAKFRTNVDECFHMLLRLMAESRKREKSKLHKRGYHCCVIL